MHNRWMKRQRKVYHPGQADCAALWMYEPEQPNLYHPRRADVWMGENFKFVLFSAFPLFFLITNFFFITSYISPPFLVLKLMFKPRINSSLLKPRKMGIPHPSPWNFIYVLRRTAPTFRRDDIDFNLLSEYTDKVGLLNDRLCRGGLWKRYPNSGRRGKPLNKTSSNCFLSKWSSIVCQIKRPRSSSQWRQLT